MGTSLQTFPLTDADFEGLEGCNEVLVRSRPDVVRQVHASFLQAGADIIETNTFGSMSVVLNEYDIAHQAYELTKTAAQLARQTADEFSTPDWPRFVAGSMGPTTKLATLGHIKYDDLKASYVEQALGFLDGGADLYLIETCQDLLQVKAALAGIAQAEAQRGRTLPKVVSVTVELTGTLLVGSDIAAVVAALAPYDLLALGMNCATGPKEMEEHIKYLADTSPFAISCVPNAGIPENRGGVAHYHLTPDEMDGYLERFVTSYGVRLIGGCCGTRPEHIAHLAELAKRVTPKRIVNPPPAQLTSLYSAVNMVMEPAPLLVGERTNANGSKKFKDLLAEENYDDLVAIGKQQVQKGAHVLDLCTAYVGRDEVRDMNETVDRFNQQLDVPLMIDSTEVPVIAEALKRIGGRAIVNSINLEDGEERLNQVVALCKEFGAAVVALTIDEDGMAKTPDRKLAVAQRIYDLCVHQHGLRPEDIVFDTLTFTLGSGDEEFRRAGLDTIEGIRLIKEAMPGVGFILGISNISFGLDKGSRPLLNSVFMHMAVEAGLTMAIVNSAHIIPLAKLTEAEKQLCYDLIHDRRERDAEGNVVEKGKDPLMDFMSYFATNTATATSKDAGSRLPENLDERLQYRIVDGNKTGLEADLAEALKTKSALEIINSVLLEGMKTVGDLFGRGEMQLPFVLQSAETMKKAVAYLEPFMEKNDSTGGKGTCVLATVKGDVHDIGKNLVDIILTNNGYKVHNLGIKQPIDNILSVAKAETADCIAMSGLLVKSTAIMKDNLELMQRDGWRTPVILGGAALTQRFVEEDCQNVYDGPVIYARSAFDSLHTMDDIVRAKAQGTTYLSPSQLRKNTALELPFPMEGGTEDDDAPDVEAVAKPAPRSSVTQGLPVPTPPYWGTRIIEVSPEEVYPFMNDKALVTGYWSFRRGNKTSKEHDEFLQEKVYPILEKMKRDAIEQGWLKPKAIIGYFPCAAECDELVVYEPDDHATEKLRFTFPRGGAKNLCLTDYVRTVEEKNTLGPDVLPMHIVTVGQEASAYSKTLFDADEYTDYFFFHGFSVEAAEGMAEVAHRRVREELGITAKEAGKSATELLKPSAYQGCRYSFGYPACPDLADQAPLFELLHPERIGIKLTESFLLEPEQSTSALVFHHPEAYYFDVR
jgi:5-methyltetrahydrofolate--homocysteine methyltransferase